MSNMYWYGPAATGILGLILFLYGRRGRRKGTDPHCRKCDYNLTGLTSERCPECGSNVNRSGTRRGARTRRPVLAFIGLAVLLSSAGSLALKTIRWFRSLDYPDRPTWWLMWEAKRTDRSGKFYPWGQNPPGALAFEELKRRAWDGELSSQQRRKLAHIALDECLAWPGLRQYGQMEGVADWTLLALSDCVTPAERQQYCESCYWITWQARPRAVLADGIPIELAIFSRDNVFLETAIESVTIIPPGGTPQVLRPLASPEEEEDLYLPSPLGRGERIIAWFGDGCDPADAGVRSLNCRWRWIASPTVPGVWEFQCRVKIELSDLRQCYPRVIDLPPEDPPRPPYSAVRTLVTRSEVLAEEVPGLNRLVDDPKLEAEVLRRIDATLGWSWPESKLLYAGCLVKGFPLPVDLAFDVDFEVEGRTYRGLPFVVKKDRPPATEAYPFLNESRMESPQHTWTPVPRPDHVQNMTITLTPNPALARKTVDIFEIWGKPIRKEITLPARLPPSRPWDR